MQKDLSARLLDDVCTGCHTLRSRSLTGDRTHWLVEDGIDDASPLSSSSVEVENGGAVTNGTVASVDVAAINAGDMVELGATAVSPEDVLFDTTDKGSLNIAEDDTSAEELANELDAFKL